MERQAEQYQFLYLTPDQREEFVSLESNGQTSTHGRLELGEVVEMHQHDAIAMYVVNGRVCFSGTGVKRELGQDQEKDAVLVSANQPHGWLSRLDGTEIVQVHGPTLVDRILSV